MLIEELRTGNVVNFWSKRQDRRVILAGVFISHAGGAPPRVILATDKSLEFYAAESPVYAEGLIRDGHEFCARCVRVVDLTEEEPEVPWRLLRGVQKPAACFDTMPEKIQMSSSCRDRAKGNIVAASSRDSELPETQASGQRMAARVRQLEDLVRGLGGELPTANIKQLDEPHRKQGPCARMLGEEEDGDDDSDSDVMARPKTGKQIEKGGATSAPSGQNDAMLLMRLQIVKESQRLDSPSRASNSDGIQSGQVWLGRELSNKLRPSVIRFKSLWRTLYYGAEILQLFMRDPLEHAVALLVQFLKGVYETALDHGDGRIRQPLLGLENIMVREAFGDVEEELGRVLVYRRALQSLRTRLYNVGGAPRSENDHYHQQQQCNHQVPPSQEQGTEHARESAGKGRKGEGKGGSHHRLKEE